jgi:hypothetical protein
VGSVGAILKRKKHTIVIINLSDKEKKKGNDVSHFKSYQYLRG